MVWYTTRDRIYQVSDIPDKKEAKKDLLTTEQSNICKFSFYI